MRVFPLRYSNMRKHQFQLRILKSHSHERQRLRLRVRLRQDDNVASMGCVKRKEEWVLHPFFAFDTTSSLTQCYHFDADANVDARLNGPLVWDVY